jgi:signal transduction histidine kinase
VTLARRLALMATLVAVACVLFTGVTAVGLYRQGALTAARVALGRDADTVAATLDAYAERRPAAQRRRSNTVARQLARRDITALIAGPGDPVPAPFTPVDLARALPGSASSWTREGWIFQSRSIGAGRVVMLAQPVDTGLAESRAPLSQLVVPLLFGLLGGALAGWWMARRLAAPLSALTAGARRLSAGERDVRVRADGPAELADVARALNELSDALGASEARQRRFLTDVSHELRTPLTAVTGYAEGLAEGVVIGADVIPAGQVIQAEAARLSRRVDDLLALARTEADDFRLTPAPADLRVLIEEAGRAWRPRAESAQVNLEIGVPSSPLVVVTDAERVRQAVDALADNALRVLSPGARLAFACGADTSAAWVQVSDDGPGLAEADLAVAFERGRLTERYRGDRPVGSGLGLALVGELARRLGGYAVAQARPGGGVTFAVVLPLPARTLPERSAYPAAI